LIPRFDIFYVEAGGATRWIEVTASIEDAQARIQELAVGATGEYLIVSQETGHKTVVHAHALNAAGSKIPGALSWQKVSRAALEETDPQKLADRVSAAETVILQRLQEIRNSPNHDSERAAIREALQALLAHKNRKLNLPDWKP
jgi:cobalamin biosynthesis protein CbiG